jgi:hypothetical protein
MLMDSICAMRFNVVTKRAYPMKTLLLAILLLASPALVQNVWAQTKLTPKSTGARVVDNCAPIGRTANGELVYSMKCDNIPAPPPPQQAEVKQAAPPPPEPETERTGLFGMSFDRRPKDQ